LNGFPYNIVDPVAAIISVSPTHANILGTRPTGGTRAGMYRYLQCDVEVTIKLNTTMYHQGCLCAGWFPQETPLTCATTYYAPSHDGILMSASLQDQCTFTVPFCSSRPHYDLLTWGPSHPGSYFISVINPLKVAAPNIADNVQVGVYLQMKNIKLYGVLPQVAPAETPTWQMQSTHTNKFKTNSEAEVKDDKGISASGPKDIVSTVLSTVPLVGDIVKLGSAIMNLDKPSSDQSTTFVQTRNNRGMGLLTGIDYSEPMSQFPSYAVARSIGNFESSDMSVVDYCKKPALLWQQTFTSTGPIVTLTMHPMKYWASTQRLEPDFLAFGTSLYDYWRGSIKLLFHFVSTPFYSCRLRISVSHADGPPASIDAGTGVFSKIVDVKGDTWTTLVVPYLTKRIWSYVDYDYEPSVKDYSYVYIEALTDVLGSSLPAQALIYMNIYRSAGDDYQLAGLRTAQKIASNSTVIDSTQNAKKGFQFSMQCSLKDKFKEPFDGAGVSTGIKESGIFMADGSTTIADTCKRFYPYTPDSFNSFSFPYVTDSNQAKLPVFWWPQTFMYWRGSRRLKWISNTTPYVQSLTSPDGSTTYASSYVNNNQTIMEVAVPWFSTESYYVTQERDAGTNWWQYAKPVRCTNNVILNSSLYFSIGDDLTFFYIIQPFVSQLFASTANQIAVKSQQK